MNKTRGQKSHATVPLSARVSWLEHGTTVQQSDIRLGETKTTCPSKRISVNAINPHALHSCTCTCEIIIFSVG
jgi:hypothetical protein